MTDRNPQTTNKKKLPRPLWQHFGMPVWSGLLVVIRWLFRQSPRGPLFAPAPITSLALFLISACLAFSIYAFLVQKAYRDLFTAYDQAVVMRDILSEDPTIRLDTREEDRRAVLFRALQLLGKKSSDDTPEALEKADDKYFGVYRALVASHQAKELSLLETRTVLIVAQLARFASASDTDTSAKSNLEPIERTATSLSCVLASQPTAADRLNGLWHSDVSEPIPQELDSVLESLGDNLLLPSGPWLILWPIERTPQSKFLSLRKEPTGLDWRLNRQLELSLFPPDQVADADAVRLVFRQMGVDRRFNSLRNQNKTPANDEQKLHFTHIDEFIFTLIARLHANSDVKKARAFITLVQGPEQLGMLVGFIWMVLLLASRFLKRTLVSIEFAIVRRRIYLALGNIGAEDDDASKKMRHEKVEELSRQLASRNNDAEKSKYTWQGDLGRWRTSAVNYIKTTHKDDDSQLRRVGIFLAKAVVGLAIPLLMIVNGAYLVLASLWWNGPFAALRACREAIGRLLEVCSNELNNTTPSSDVVRHSCRYLRERDRSSRWIIRWIARALPAVGFIGTVRGISAALSSADSIVRAQTAAEQAAAITAVAGTLGIAFTTTLIALLFGLITSYFDDLQSAQEGDFVRDVEESLVPLLEPSMFTST